LDNLKFSRSGFKVSIFYLLLSSLVINLLAMAMPLMMLQTYDRILPNFGYGTLTMLIIGVVSAVILEVILKILRSYLTSWSGSVFEHKTSCDAVEHILNSDISKFENQGSGAYLQKIAAVGRLRSFYGGQSLITMVDLPFIPTFLILIYLIAGNLVIIPLALFGLFCCVALIVAWRLKKQVMEKDFSGKIRYNYIIETLTGIHTIKSLGLGQFFIRRHDRLMDRISASQLKVAITNNVAANCGMLFSRIMTVAVVSFGAVKVINGEMGTGGLAACILLSGRIMQPVQRVFGLWTRFQSFFIDKKELKEVFDLPGAIYKDIKLLQKPGGTLQFTDVCFHHGQENKLLLDRFNLTLTQGSSIAVEGHSGSGRSTLLNLIAGQLSPTSGTIKVDGTAPDQIEPSLLGRYIGYLAENGTVFNGTIRENLTFFGSLSEEDIMPAVDRLGISDIVAQLPDGYETELTDSTTDPIPPGIKQRITIARVLAFKPRIILFNNADRGLDKNGYNYLFKILGMLKSRTTMIIVSDDRNILRLADREYYLTDGALSETFPEDSKKFSAFSFRELQI
jgi:ATP-binding cassette, subfamily C, bacterial LapB